MASKVADDIDGECWITRPAIRKWKKPVRESRKQKKWTHVTKFRIKIKELNQ
jgi:hypothetical protein